MHPFLLGVKMKLLFVEPQFKERIWGGRKLETVLDYQIPKGLIGEAWVISGHHHGQSKILNGSYKGQYLGDVYQAHKKELFNDDPSKTFPLLVKILDASKDLSIQVHPDDAYALEYEHEYGKTECWYVLGVEKDTKIIDGHTANSKQEFIEKIEKNDLSLWHEREIKKGDFISIPARKVHAIGGGALIYEVQQSSDTTYRIYDYDRVDQQGKKRELHLKQALDVIHIPDIVESNQTKVFETPEAKRFTYLENEYFKVSRLELDGTYQCSTDQYMLISILSGSGRINDQAVKQGDHIVVCDIHGLDNVNYTGSMALMITERVV